jgi:hypothetical protein
MVAIVNNSLPGWRIGLADLGQVLGWHFWAFGLLQPCLVSLVAFCHFAGLLSPARAGGQNHEEKQGKRGRNGSGRHHAPCYACVEGRVIQDAHVNICYCCCPEAATEVGLFGHFDDASETTSTLVCP